ncbi:hypothetical protein [Streptomyces sp. NPDC047108]|uniref:hypothetical protein n=1 Tax=Streptomyces sp. NPDC047108 TaxID=3155025 RepID=UPI0033CCD03F
MPIAIAVTSPDLVLPSADPQTPPAAVIPPPHAQSLDAALADTHRLLEQHGYLIVLYPAGEAQRETHQRLHTIRSVLESDRIALLGLDLPPLAVAALALQLRRLSVCDFSPGVLASATRLLAHYVYAGALLGSVSRLDRVPVSLASHATSWVPGSQFGVLVNPAQQLTKVGGAAQEPLRGPEFGTELLFARGRLQSDWVTSGLAPAWRVQQVREVELPAESARWWGTSRLVEFASAIGDLSVLYQVVASVRRDDCRWCGLQLIGDRCAFCSAPVAPPPARKAPLALTAS